MGRISFEAPSGCWQEVSSFSLFPPGLLHFPVSNGGDESSASYTLNLSVISSTPSSAFKHYLGPTQTIQDNPTTLRSSVKSFLSRNVTNISTGMTPGGKCHGGQNLAYHKECAGIVDRLIYQPF